MCKWPQTHVFAASRAQSGSAHMCKVLGRLCWPVRSARAGVLAMLSSGLLCNIRVVSITTRLSTAHALDRYLCRDYVERIELLQRECAALMEVVGGAEVRGVCTAHQRCMHACACRCLAPCLRARQTSRRAFAHYAYDVVWVRSERTPDVPRVRHTGIETRHCW